MPGCHVRVARYRGIVTASQAFQTISQEAEAIETGVTVYGQAQTCLSQTRDPKTDVAYSSAAPEAPDRRGAERCAADHRLG